MGKKKWELSDLKIEGVTVSLEPSFMVNVARGVVFELPYFRDVVRLM